VDSWITGLTTRGPGPKVRHPHRTTWVTRLASGTGKPGQNGRAAEDLAERGVTNDDAGSGARTARAGTDRLEECLDRPRDPLPTRVEACPPLPASYADALDEAVAALGLSLSRTARFAIDGHVRLLVAWNTAINLTSVREPAQIAIRHVADSLAAVAELDADGIDAFLDLGSGGGFPGVPLAAALPAVEGLLVDSVAKKAGFLQVATEAIGLAGRIRVGSVRAEALAADRCHRGRWPAVTVRAVAPLAELVELAFPLLRPEGVLIAWKRGNVEAEISAARRAIDVLGGGSLNLTPVVLAGLDHHSLVVARRGRGTVPDAYPREVAARRRRPW
jgi:16S rRNA (guanine527-N7)-methyltransferase